MQMYGTSHIHSLQEVTRRQLIEYVFSNDLLVTRVTRNFWLTFQFCIQKQLIPTKLNCKCCGNPMRLVKHPFRENDGCYWRCYVSSRNCSSKVALRSGTMFYHSRLTIMEQLKVMLHYFVRNYNANEAANEFKEMTGVHSYQSV